MQKVNQTYKIAPADRLASVSEYYFSKKLKEVAQMNAEGKEPFGGQLLVLHFCYVLLSGYNSSVRLPT